MDERVLLNTTLKLLADHDASIAEIARNTGLSTAYIWRLKNSPEQIKDIGVTKWSKLHSYLTGHPVRLEQEQRGFLQTLFS